MVDWHMKPAEPPCIPNSHAVPYQAYSNGSLVETKEQRKIPNLVYGRVDSVSEGKLVRFQERNVMTMVGGSLHR